MIDTIMNDPTGILGGFCVTMALMVGLLAYTIYRAIRAGEFRR